MIRYDEKNTPWILSSRLKGIIEYLQCDFITFDYISKDKVVIIPIPIKGQDVESCYQIYSDEKLYIHPNFFLKSYQILPHTLNEYDRMLLCQASDRLTYNLISDLYKNGGNAISVTKALDDGSYIKLFLCYNKGYMINRILNNKHQALLCLDKVHNEIKKLPHLFDFFAYNPNDYQMTQLDANGLRVIQLNHPKLTFKQYQFAKYLAQADEFSNPSIANSLGISTRTVNDYFIFLKDKLGTTDRVSTVLKCREYFKNFWLS